MPSAAMPSAAMRTHNPTDAVNETAFREAAAQMPPPFDPSEEYRKLLAVAEGRERERDGTKQEDYQYLMSRERRVLDTVDRVVNDSIATREAAEGLLTMPLHLLAMRSAGALRGLLDDLVASRSLEDARRALSDRKRLPFIGVAMIAVAVLLGFVELSAL